MLKVSLLLVLILQGPAGGPQSSRSDWPQFGPPKLIQTVRVDRLTPVVPAVGEQIRRRWGYFVDFGFRETFIVSPDSFLERKRGQLVLRAGVRNRTYLNLRIDGKFPYGVTVWFLERELVFYLEGHGDQGERYGMFGPFAGDPRTELPRAVDDVTGMGDPNLASARRRDRFLLHPSGPTSACSGARTARLRLLPLTPPCAPADA